MATVDVSADGGVEELREKKSLGQKTFEIIKKQPLGTVGFLVVLAMIVMAVFANYLAGYDP